MIERLKNRRQFLRIASANRKWVTVGIVLQAAPQPPDDRAAENGTRYGGGKNECTRLNLDPVHINGVADLQAQLDGLVRG